MSRYVDRNAAAKSYRPVAGTMSPGLKRAREPYRLRNAFTGLALGVFVAGVWAYSISAVKQDDFTDVDEEARALGATGAGSGLGAGVVLTHGKDDGRSFMEGKAPVERVVEVASRISERSDVQPRGLLLRLDGRLPWLLDPQGKTLVWGAPPVDNLGKISMRP